VSPAHFEEQLGRLREIGEVVRLDDELGRGRFAGLGRRRPRFAVTFDDGYVDNLTTAVAALERHDVPATLFVPSGFIGTSAFWWDRLDRLVMLSEAPVDALRDAFAACGVVLPTWSSPSAAPNRIDFHTTLHDGVTWLAPRQIDELIDRVVGHLGVAAPETDGRPMTADELATISRHPLITIGAHTANHRVLTKLDDDAVLDELVSGARALDELIGAGHRLLAYPHGAADRRVARLAAKAGFTHALTTEGRTVSRIDPPRLLPRINPQNVDGAAFAGWLHAPD
jgi:peptidoglycan/xylan/chitin deacetylase (PgdA/CDA1 family)